MKAYIEALKTFTADIRDAEDYCKANNINVDLTKDNNLWAVWISYPNGIDRVYCKNISTDLEAYQYYFKAIDYAAGVWWELQKEINAIVPPPPPLVPQVPMVPKIPIVPPLPNLLIVPKVPSVN